MIRTITQVGEELGVVIDRELLERTNLKPGDPVDLAVGPGGTITITPHEAGGIGAEDFTAKVEDVMKRYARTMQRLA